MYLSSQNLKNHVAAADKGRYALNTIAITDKGTISSDGHLLLFIPYPKVEQEIPAITGIKHEAFKGNTILISSADAKKAASMAPTKPTKKEFGLIHTQAVRGKVKFAASDGEQTQTLSVKQTEGPYPDIAKVIPDFKDATEITFDLNVLLKALKALSAASNGESVTLRIKDIEGGVGFSTDDGVAMLAMPMSKDAHNPDALVGLRKKSAPKAKAKVKEKKHVSKSKSLTDAA